MTEKEIKGLGEVSRSVRELIVEMMVEAGSGHLGGSLSIVEILVVLYHKFMRLREGEPDWPERDRFVLSKGHAGPALYAVLQTKGYLSRNDLMTLNKAETILPSHCDMTRTPGVDMFGGSLGMGLSAAVGMALAAGMDKKDIRVFFIIGDGESDEGQIWEAAMAASKYRLGNLVGFLDGNKMQIDGTVDKVMPLEPLKDKWLSFGWDVREIDGHNVEEISGALKRAIECGDKPSMIIAHTVKGKGLSFSENILTSHNMKLTPGHLAQALKELRASRK